MICHKLERKKGKKLFHFQKYYFKMVITSPFWSVSINTRIKNIFLWRAHFELSVVVPSCSSTLSVVVLSCSCTLSIVVTPGSDRLRLLTYWLSLAKYYFPANE